MDGCERGCRAADLMMKPLHAPRERRGFSLSSLPRRRGRVPAPVAVLLSFLFKPALTILSLSLAWNCMAGVRVLDAKTYHLRSGAEPEWQEFAGKRPYGARLDLR